LCEDFEEVKQNLKFLLEEYKEALKQFGTRPNPFPEKDDISYLMGWMLKEFQVVPSVISGASDFTAVFSVESLRKLLSDVDCDDLPKFRRGLSRFPDAAGTSAIQDDENILALKKKFMKEFWIDSGQEFAKKIARDKLEEVLSKFCRNYDVL
jgi:hypothetical protein